MPMDSRDPGQKISTFCLHLALKLVGLEGLLRQTLGASQAFIHITRRSILGKWPVADAHYDQFSISPLNALTSTAEEWRLLGQPLPAEVGRYFCTQLLMGHFLSPPLHDAESQLGSLNMRTHQHDGR